MSSMVQRGASFLDRLNTREKLLLLLMAVLFGLMGTAVFMMNFTSSLEEIETDIDGYERALGLLAENRGDFEARLEQAERLRRLLRQDAVQMHGFLERQCIAANVDRPSSYNDNVIPQRNRVSGEASITEIETRATINAVEPMGLARLLQRIANAPELVVLKVIDLQPARGQRGLYRVDLTVSTYRQEGPES
jgi:hypothetical protein